MPDKPILLDWNIEELKTYLTALGQPAFRAGQLFAWLYRGVPFAEMSTLPKALRQTLAERAVDQPMRLQEVFPSQKDDTVKFLNAFGDGNLIESVLMRYKYGYTLCISTQIGCRMGCAFCASTLHGCERDLTAGEMAAQVILANQYLGEKGRVGHVVLMGSGEPLENYEHSVRFLRLVNHPDGLGIGLRSVSLSTCGLAPQIRALADEALPVTLSLSLHAPNDELRAQIMPIAKRYPLRELMEAVRYYVTQTGRRAIFEYALIDRFNSDPAHARELAKLIGHLQCHVNLIPLNRVEEHSLAPASPEAVRAFLHTLETLGVSATLRREMGADIAGACGQLRNRHLKEPTKPAIINS